MNKNYFLTICKGLQSIRAGEEQMDKLARMWVHRKGTTKSISQTLRDVIDKQYEVEEREMSERIKKIKYSNFK